MFSTGNVEKFYLPAENFHKLLYTKLYINIANPNINLEIINSNPDKNATHFFSKAKAKKVLNPIMKFVLNHI